MTDIIILGIALFLIATGAFVTVLCMNSSRLNNVQFSPRDEDEYGDVPEPFEHDGGDRL